ncbi:SCO3374 family protein [Streptomyces sp. NBC_00344]|uniref:SCO3374 family protein n=1 Tax=Streptomyces sp. NBC_00344 TaxID=2975720 RepID=UPI002E21BF0C
MAFTVPSPRAPLDSVVQWYASELGWAAVPGPPVALPTGLRFDVLELPVDAGFAVLRRVPRTGPVAVAGSRMQLLVAAGSADELPGLLDWLEWGGITLDLTAIGAHGRITAPAPPGPLLTQGAAGWLRPPEPGHEVEPALPVFSGVGKAGGAPDLVRLLDVAATECHRARMARIAAAFQGAPPGNQRNQPLAFS